VERHGIAAAFRLNAPVLADGVIRLEPLGEAHLSGLAALGQDPAVARNTRVPEPWPPGFERTWLDLYEQGSREGTRDGYAVVDAETGAFLGIAGVVDIHPDANQGEIGYALAAEARGRGIATRALRLVTRYALDELRLERLELQIATDNDASIRVAEKCGYRREGILRSLYIKPGRRGDFAIYSRLRTD
jgi:RimJ/RimL family protein N-acetyltransferase